MTESKVVPLEPTNAMIIAGLEASLEIMKEYGCDGLSPFSDYPPPGEITKRCYRAMVKAAEIGDVEQGATEK